MNQRLRVAGALGVVLVAGLATRRVDAVPNLLADHAGDALWTAAVVLGLALLWPQASARQLALAGFALSVAVELSQLWTPDWLEELRDNELASLVLGRGWLWGDLVRYAFGAVFGFLLLRRPVEAIEPSPASRPRRI